MQLIVPCLFGLEGLAGDELRRLNMENVRVEDRRVLFTGDENALAKANICLRTGERVMVVLAQFQAKTFEELFQGVLHANLEDYIPADGQFPVKGHCLNSQLMSVSDCQAIIKKAASRRLGEKYGVSWLPETGAKYQLQFSIMNDRVQLYLDTSGPGLHKRGYRANANEAPLRETLAAATKETLSLTRGAVANTPAIKLLTLASPWASPKLPSRVCTAICDARRLELSAPKPPTLKLTSFTMVLGKTDVIPSRCP